MSESRHSKYMVDEGGWMVEGRGIGPRRGAEGLGGGGEGYEGIADWGFTTPGAEVGGSGSIAWWGPGAA
jgi:hypothetical protein